jgi:ABC-type phosphate transport system substrate-binding protein
MLMRYRIVASILGVLLTGAPSTIAGDGPVTVAIVVNSANPVTTLSAKQLKQIFAGDAPRWPDGQKIHTMATRPDAPEHSIAIRFLFGMDEAEYQKYALQARFTGKTEEIPQNYGSSLVVASMVGLMQGAIAFVNANLVNPNLKVVKIDGLKPGDPGYPLTSHPLTTHPLTPK